MYNKWLQTKNSAYKQEYNKLKKEVKQVLRYICFTNEM